MSFPSTLNYDDVVRELVKLFGPKTYLHIGELRSDVIGAVLTYKSVNRMSLCVPTMDNYDSVNAMLKTLQFGGEVEWFNGTPDEIFDTNTFAHQFDLIIVDGATDEDERYDDLVRAWKLCNSILITHEIKTLSVQKAFGRFISSVNGQSELSLSRFSGGEGTMVVTR